MGIGVKVASASFICDAHANGLREVKVEIVAFFGVHAHGLIVATDAKVSVGVTDFGGRFQFRKLPCYFNKLPADINGAKALYVQICCNTSEVDWHPIAIVGVDDPVVVIVDVDGIGDHVTICVQSGNLSCNASVVGLVCLCGLHKCAFRQGHTGLESPVPIAIERGFA